MITTKRLRHVLGSLLVTACAGESADPPPREAFLEVCAPYFACDCETYRYRDVETCMTNHHVEFAQTLGEADAIGGHADLDCYFSRARPGEDMCLGEGEYHALHPLEPSPREPTRCGECQTVYGEQEVGEPCLSISRGSDCAQGLLCEGQPGACVDPCTPTPLGEPCYFGTTSCGPGRVCDHHEGVCREFSEIGEPCALNECAEGLYCEYSATGDNTCAAAAGLDDSCATTECLPTLECLYIDGSPRCRPIPGEGEHCEDRCAGDLFCNYLMGSCMRWGELGEPCDAPRRCARGLVCESGACASAPGASEPCDEICELGFKCVDAVCTPEKPRICVM